MQGGGWTEKTAGLHDGGTTSMDMDYDPTSAIHRALVTFQIARTKLNFRDVFPDTTFVAFAGLVEGMPVDKKVNDLQTCKLTIQISGPVTPR